MCGILLVSNVLFQFPNMVLEDIGCPFSEKTNSDSLGSSDSKVIILSGKSTFLTEFFVLGV